MSDYVRVKVFNCTWKRPDCCFKDDVESHIIKDEIWNELDVLKNETAQFLALLMESQDKLKDRKYKKEQVEKVKKIRCNLEKIKKYFGDIL